MRLIDVIKLLVICLTILSCWTVKEGCESGYHKETRYKLGGFDVMIYDEWIECNHDTIINGKSDSTQERRQGNLYNQRY